MFYYFYPHFLFTFSPQNSKKSSFLWNSDKKSEHKWLWSSSIHPAWSISISSSQLRDWVALLQDSITKIRLSDVAVNIFHQEHGWRPRAWLAESQLSFQTTTWNVLCPTSPRFNDGGQFTTCFSRGFNKWDNVLTQQSKSRVILSVALSQQTGSDKHH